MQQRFFAGLHFQADLVALTADLKVFPQIIVNVNVREKKHLESIPAVAQAIRGAEEELRDSGRVVVRYSGTEPMAWVVIEAESEGAVSLWPPLLKSSGGTSGSCLASIIFNKESTSLSLRRGVP